MSVATPPVTDGVKLTPFEKHVLAFIDGKRPVEVIRRAAGLDEAEVKTAGPGDATFVGLLEVTDEAQQRGLAVAVAPDDADALALPHTEADLVEEHPDAVGLGDLLQVDQQVLYAAVDLIHDLLPQERRAPAFRRFRVTDVTPELWRTLVVWMDLAQDLGDQPLGGAVRVSRQRLIPQRLSSSSTPAGGAISTWVYSTYMGNGLFRRRHR